MSTMKQNAAIATFAVSVAFSLLAGSAAADTDSSNSGLGATAGLMGVAGTAVAAERDRLTGATDSTVQIRLAPVRGMGPGLADLTEQGNRTRVVVGMSSVPSDPAKLMHGGQSAHDGVVADLHMTRECSIVRKHDIVSDRAIVADVTVSQKISAITDARSSLARRAAIHGNEFAKSISVADFQKSRLTRVFQILRLLPDRAIGVKLIARACSHRPGQRDVMLQPAVFANHHFGPDDAIRPDVCSRSDFCRRIDNGRRVNLHVAHLSRNVNINSPSETTASFTTQ